MALLFNSNISFFFNTLADIFHNIILKLIQASAKTSCNRIGKEIERKCKGVNESGRSVNQDAGGALQDALKLILKPAVTQKTFSQRKT